MTHLSNIMKKEIRELMTPGSVASVLLMVILFAFLGSFLGGEISHSVSLPSMGLVDFQTVTTEEGEWDGYEILRAYYEANGISSEDFEKMVVILEEGDILGQMTEKGLSLVLVMDENFAESVYAGVRGQIHQYYVYKQTGMISGAVSSVSATSIIGMLNNSLSAYLIGTEELPHHYFLSNPIDGAHITTYINGQPQDDVTPYDISNALTGQTMLIPMIIMIVIMMIGSIVISSMGSEKENKTLETLLTLPIKRSTIVTGKILAAAVVGLVFGLAYMLGISIYIGSMTGMAISGTDVDLSSFGFTLGITDYILIMFSMFLAISCALGICMILGAFAKNYKSAQTMTMPLAILVIIPMFVIMFSGFSNSNLLIQIILFAIPFSHPMMAMDALMNGDVMFVVFGLIYMAVFAAVSIFITVKLYNSDILITGLGQNKYVEMLKGQGKKRR
ncbi:ABC transporter permease protein [methanogenic archaeon mixed culture ISO4-G1]|nr:ABC transporter permease protein [methanogenic archaeon mixed culture ISO4-G1]